MRKENWLKRGLGYRIWGKRWTHWRWVCILYQNNAHQISKANCLLFGLEPSAQAKALASISFWHLESRQREANYFALCKSFHPRSITAQRSVGTFRRNAALRGPPSELISMMRTARRKSFVKEILKTSKTSPPLRKSWARMKSWTSRAMAYIKMHGLMMFYCSTYTRLFVLYRWENMGVAVRCVVLARYFKGSKVEFGYVQIILPEAGKFTTVLEVNNRPFRHQFDWEAPELLKNAMLLDPPGMDYKGGADHMSHQAKSYVETIAAERPCTFVWCVPLGRGGVESEVSKFALNMASRAPSCILPVVTMHNESFRKAFEAPSTSHKKQHHEDKLLEQQERMICNPDDSDAETANREYEMLACRLQNLKNSKKTHQFAEEMDAHLNPIRRRLPSPAAVLGLVQFETGEGFDLNYALLSAFKDALQRRFLQHDDVRVVLAELARLESNTYDHMAELMDMSHGHNNCCKGWRLPPVDFFFEIRHCQWSAQMRGDMSTMMRAFFAFSLFVFFIFSRIFLLLCHQVPPVTSATPKWCRYRALSLPSISFDCCFAKCLGMLFATPACNHRRFARFGPSCLGKCRGLRS